MIDGTVSIHPSVTAEPEEARLRKQLGLGDLILAQILCVVGSSWVGIAAKLGRAHVVFWVVSMLLFYLPLAAVVIYLNRLMPVEGGLYRWAKAGFGEMAGFLTAWNLWVYAVIVVGSILFVVPTDLSYMLGPSAAWIPASKMATLLIIGSLVAAIAMVAIHGLDIGKWLHNAGSVMILVAYAVLLPLPLWAMWRGSLHGYEAFPIEMPKMNWFALAIFGQMTVGALSGFEYVAILAGECRSAVRTIGQSVLFSAPVICLMFILGTSSVLAFVGNQPINVIGPIPQTFRLAFGNSGPASWVAPLAILMLIARAIASASLIFTGLTRLPMTASWDHVVPTWFSRLDPRRRTPVNSILFVATVVTLFVLLSMLGVGEQEASQVLGNASVVHYALAYMALFLLPLVGALRVGVPWWLKGAAVAGLFASVVSLAIAVIPIVDVVSKEAYATKIVSIVLLTNAAGIVIFRAGERRRIDT